MDARRLRIANRVAMMPTKEGEFAVPEGQVIAHLQKFLSAKYAIDMAYRNFSDRLLGPYRDGLAEHWYKHAEDERKNTYALNMKVIGMGADPMQSYIQIPACPPNVDGFIQVLMALELDAIEAGRQLAEMAGANVGLRVFAEDTVVLDTHHLDDLRRWSEKTKR
jgi:bacterioferritin (cytochrome b1)